MRATETKAMTIPKEGSNQRHIQISGVIVLRLHSGRSSGMLGISHSEGISSPGMKVGIGPLELIEGEGPGGVLVVTGVTGDGDAILEYEC
jgi:hypothetical protein